MGKSAPKAPDPVATANAQYNANTAAAQYSTNMSHVNQYTPYGSLTYKQTGTNSDGSPQYSSYINFTPTGQQIFDQQQQQDKQVNNIANGYMQRIQDTMGQGFNLGGMPAIRSSADGGGIGLTTNVNGAPIQSQLDYSKLTSVPVTADDFAAQGQQAQDAIMSRLRPELDRNQELLDNKLANQGIVPGSDAWNYEQKVAGQNRNDAYNQAILSGLTQQNNLYNQALSSRQQLQGEANDLGQFANSAQNQQFTQGQQNAALRNSAQQQMYNQQYNNAQLSNAARQQALAEAIQLRELPLNEFNALRSASQIQAPSFQQTAAPNIQAGNVQGLTQDAYNQQVGTYNANMGGLFGLGSSALMGYMLR